MREGFVCDPHRRKELRWTAFDYRSPGPYHVVNCLEYRVCRFGFVHDSEMRLNDVGMMIEETWLSAPLRYPAIHLDAFVIMPNHMHHVFWFESSGVCAYPTVGEVMAWFKSRTTIRYIAGVKSGDWPPFEHRFWQRNYFDRVIRDDRELDSVRRYVENNPATWLEDSLYPVP
jgi:REP element-mobilizing transposase RayT